MTEPRIALPAGTVAAQALADGLAEICTELSLPSAFSEAVTAEAAEASAAGHPDAAAWLVLGARVDRTDLPLVTLDPLGSRDLDQAFAIELEGGGAGGFTLHYAIADVAAHARPGGAIDAESRARGETVYLPGQRVPLHPAALSEDAASLLPGVDRLAVLWTLTVDGSGELVGSRVGRALVRSTAQLDYAGAQAALDAGTPHPQIANLALVGPVLQAAARGRGAIELPEPSQELVPVPGSDAWRLAWLPRHPLEDWNAQLSLLTGRAAATIMLGARSGLLRTLPPAEPGAEALLRTAAQALSVPWPAEQSLAERLATLDAGEPAHLALIDRSRALLRGAGYLPLLGLDPAPQEAIHSAVAAPYAHVTAPLRRLGDRFATEAVLAAVAGVAPPDWVASSLVQLPDLLRASGRRAGSATRAVVDLAEALVLAPYVGQTFEAAVVEVAGKNAEIRIVDPPIRARADAAGLTAGTRAQVRLTLADPTGRRVRFAAQSG
ncbi:MAG: RNB domain-containing ribonuclease [Solirubrobacteraceae bacterium]|nr:RNB domain-containing ribonuclease [Solirubrobacteraceae bacterium]